MAKIRVYELAKELGVESKELMTKLNEMGEFVRSASSTIEAPVVRRLRDAMPAKAPAAAAEAPAKRPAAPKAPAKAAPAAPAPVAEAPARAPRAADA